MPKEIIIENARIVNSTDWKSKSEYIIEQLNKDIFDNISEFDSYNIKYDKDGNELSRTKRQVKKGEIMPSVSATQVASKLHRLLRVYKPMSYQDALTLDNEEFLTANGYYLDIIFHINKYLVYLPSKQGLCSFLNITVETYNELLQNPTYCETFKSFEDSFVDTNFASAQAGIVDTKTTVAKLQIKDAGHSLKKAEENIIYNINNGINKEQVHSMLEKFTSMTQKISDKK